MKKISFFIFISLIFISAVALADELVKIDAYAHMYDLRVKLADRYGVATNFVEIDKDGGHEISTPQVQVGDTRKFWAPNLAGWIREGYDFFYLDQYLVDATCRAVGNHCYVFVEDSQWGTRVLQRYINELVEAFEVKTPANPDKGIYQIATQYFGPAPDQIDNDPRIYILAMDIKDGWKTEGDGFVAGLFNIPDQYENFEQFGVPEYDLLMYSNEVEIYYLDCMPGQMEVTSEVADAMAHEFQHMIHWGQDPYEETWLDEGCANYSMYLCGYAEPTEHIEAFCNYPNTSLLSFDNYFKDYGASTLWVTYLSDKFGGSDLITSLVANQQHGIKGINSTLSQFGATKNFDDIFIDWSIANYADTEDEIIYDHERFPLHLYDKPGGNNPYDPRPGMDPVNADTAQVVSIQPYATQYLRFSTDGVSGSDLPIQINGRENANLTGKLFVEDLDGNVLEINDFNLDRVNNGALTIPNAQGDRYYTIAVISRDTDTTYVTPTKQHIYGLASSGDMVEYGNNPNYVLEDEIVAYPNPSTGSVWFGYAPNGPTAITINLYTLDGDLVRTIEKAVVSEEQIMWDGKNDSGNDVAPGIYMYVFQVNGKVNTGKIGIVR